MNKDKLIDKIKKLFALGDPEKNNNKAESGNAMRAARKLLDIHSISSLDLVSSGSENDVSIIFKKGKNAQWIRRVYNNISVLYDCQYLTDETVKPARHLIIGNEGNRITAGIIIDHVLSTIYYQSKGKGNPFRNGAALGIALQVQAINEARMKSKEEIIPGTGIVPVDLSTQCKKNNEFYIEQEMGGSTERKNNPLNCSREGVEAGKSINLNTQIESRLAIE